MFSTLDNGMEVLIRSKAINFFIEPKGELKIDAVLLPELTEYVLTGLELNSQQNIYREDIKVLLSEESRLMFEYQTLSGSSFRLSDHRDKYIVLDFWGSWCAPCIGGFPAMKQFYNENKNRAEFVGIACRDQKVNWIQILNQTGENDLSKLFAIEGYPTKIIINPEGKIEGIYLGESEEFYLDLLIWTSYVIFRY